MHAVTKALGYLQPVIRNYVGGGTSLHWNATSLLLASLSATTPTVCTNRNESDTSVLTCFWKAMSLSTYAHVLQRSALRFYLPTQNF